MEKQDGDRMPLPSDVSGADGVATLSAKLTEQATALAANPRLFPHGVNFVSLHAAIAGVGDFTLVLDGRTGPAPPNYGARLYDGADRVARAKDLLSQGGTYPQGCSDFVCKVLGIPWESANDLMGSSPTSVGTNGNYSGLSPGDIIGWVAQPHGHVAVWIGDADPGPLIIDVRSEGASPRQLKSYGRQEVFKSSNF